MHELSPPANGFEIPALPQQVDGVSCGLYVIVYILMFANNWLAVNFPPEGTNILQLILARLLGQQKLPIGQLAKTFSAIVATDEEES